MKVELFHYVIGIIINISTVIYLQSKLLNKKLNLNNYKMYIGFILNVLLILFNFIFISGFARFLLSTCILASTCCYIFDKSLSQSFSVTIIEQIIMFTAELLFSLFLTVLNIDLINIFTNLHFMILLTNICISILAILIYNMKKIPNFYFLNKTVNFLTEINGYRKYLIVLLFILTLNILLTSMLVNLNQKIIIFINTIFIIIYGGIVFLLFNEKNSNIQFKNENKILLKNLNDYEKMLDYQRINNHENRNQLIVIRSLIAKNNKRALDYIDEVINEAKPINESVFRKVKRIPSGGLQGLVYQKMLVMQEKNMIANLEISRSINDLDFTVISTKTNFNLCRIMGVILDNAIEEASKLEEREVLISMYEDKGALIIEVANKFKDTIELDKIDDKGYTTKSSGRGYGLSLVKEIVEKNSSIINERKIIKNIFTQIIKVKL